MHPSFMYKRDKIVFNCHILLFRFPYFFLIFCLCPKYFICLLVFISLCINSNPHSSKDSLKSLLIILILAFTLLFVHNSLTNTSCFCNGLKYFGTYTFVLPLANSYYSFQKSMSILFFSKSSLIYSVMIWIPILYIYILLYG